MTKSQDNVAVVLRKKQNGTPQIKFSNTSVSRLHISHFSIIYRRPQRDVAELVLAGGSKLRSRKERRGHVLRHGWDDGSSRSLGGPPGGEGFCYAVLGGGGGGGGCMGVPWRVLPSPRASASISPGMGRLGRWQQSHQVLGCGSQRFLFFFFFSPSFSMDGAVGSKGNISPKPQMGGERRWGFLLLTLEDQAAEHQGGSSGSPRP